MSDTKRNLWGDLDAEPGEPGEPGDANPVVTLLEEQAGLLGELTRGQVRGEVRPVHPDRGPAGWEFRLLSALADYRYALFRVEQRALDFPATLYQYTGGEAKALHCPDREAFEQTLEKVLKSEPTRKALGTIRAINRLDGARLLPIDFDDEGGPRAGTVAIKRVAGRTHDGAWRSARVVAADRIVLEARIGVSGTLEATLDEDAIVERIRAAVVALLDRGLRYEPDRANPSIELTTAGARWVDEDGKLHPL